MRLSPSLSPDRAVPCCGCGATLPVTLYHAPAFDATDTATFRLVRCGQCSLVRTEPVLSEAQLGAYYSADYYGGGSRKFTALVESFTRLDNRRRARRLLALLRTATPETSKPTRILDVGCGRAHLLAALADLGCECHGVERQEFPTHAAHPNIRFHREGLENLPATATDFDAAVFWHTLEHMSDPAATLRVVAQRLRPGGIVALAVPHFGGWQAQLFKSAWFHLDLPRHTHHFDRTTLERLLVQQGLHPFRTSTWAFDQNVFGWVQSLLNALAGPAHANALYSLLKDSCGRKGPLLGWLAAAGAIAPLALLEYLLSGLLGRGATLIVYARKTPA